MKYLFSTIIIFVLAITTAQAKTLIKIDAALKKIYKKATDFEHKTYELDSSEMDLLEGQSDLDLDPVIDKEISYFIAKQDNEVLGYIFEDVVKGKWGPIHYVAAVSISGNLEKAIILKYSEVRGKTIAKKRFLKQYRKKTIHSPLKLQKDVQGISGATISSKGMTNGIKKILYYHHHLSEKGSLPS